MKKTGLVLREILHRVYGKSEFFMSQKSLAETCNLSTETVNRLVSKLDRFHTILKRPQGFRVVDAKKVLLHWASTRDLMGDVIYGAYSSDLPSKIENDLPDDVIRTAYSGYHALFESLPVDYGAVYVYGDPESVKKRFTEEGSPPNIFVLKADEHLKKVSKDGVVPVGQLYVDLWQLPSPADRFVEELDRRLGAAEIGGLEAMIAKTREGFGEFLDHIEEK